MKFGSLIALLFLSVDGRPLFAFRTGKDSSEKEWTMTGRDGASLGRRNDLSPKRKAPGVMGRHALPNPAHRPTDVR
jgi:hypothetical protein